MQRQVRWRALAVVLAVIASTLAIASPSAASDFVSSADQHYVDECGQFWPTRNTFETSVTPGGYSITWKFKLSQGEVNAGKCLKSHYRDDFVEIDLRAFGFVGQNNWDAYWITGTNLPGAVHDVAQDDAAANTTPGVTGVAVDLLEAEKDYYVSIAWNNNTGIDPDPNAQQRVSFEWVPSRWAASFPELYVCGSHWDSTQDDGWCIFGTTRAYVSHGYRNTVSVPFSGTQSFAYPVSAPPAPPSPSFPGNANVFFIKNHNATSGKVEIHSAEAAGYSAGQHNASRFGLSDQNNGWFEIEGPRDLYFVKTKNTSSGKVEIHIATNASGYQGGSGFETRFTTAEQDNGWFQMIGDALWYIKTKNTGSGKVEIHLATRSSGYQSGASMTTWITTADQSNGYFQMVGNDLFFVKTRNTGSGKVEIHSATQGSNWQAGQHSVTYIGTNAQNNGWFQMLGQDLYFVQTKNTSTGKVEIHSALAIHGYQAGAHAASYISIAEQDKGWFQIDLK